MSPGPKAQLNVTVINDRRSRLNTVVDSFDVLGMFVKLLAQLPRSCIIKEHL